MSSPNEHRETLGMPDVLDEYPVPAGRALDGVLGFRMLSVDGDEAHAEVPITDAVRQRWGLVHGGTYAALAEMLATEATVQQVWGEGNRGMGLSNATNFVRPVSEGTLHARARRLHAGRTTWVWDVEMTDDEGRLCAVTRMTIAIRPR
ncbi:MAG TPA: PaaI family thioesterase [Thermoleophilaceae bacterium]|jgi:1,4-dihydroxy-2-naphthoyl-CoA hydrolase